MNSILPEYPPPAAAALITSDELPWNLKLNFFIVTFVTEAGFSDCKQHTRTSCCCCCWLLLFMLACLACWNTVFFFFLENDGIFNRLWSDFGHQKDYCFCLSKIMKYCIFLRYVGAISNHLQSTLKPKVHVRCHDTVKFFFSMFLVSLSIFLYCPISQINLKWFHIIFTVHEKLSLDLSID